VGFCIYGWRRRIRRPAIRGPWTAKKGFLWADEHGHDGINGGYFELLTRGRQAGGFPKRRAGRW